MPSQEKSNPERDQTDESLSVERRQSDDASTTSPASFDEQADEVIEKARRRADAVLARSRAKSDRRAESPRLDLGLASAQALERERRQEDRVVQMERADADALVAEERLKQAVVLEKLREETDADLLQERSRADLAVAARDDFLGVVGHDLRNLLSVMIGFAKLIVKEGSQEQSRQYALRIDRAGTRMNRLVGDLVDIASIEAGRLAVHAEVVNAREVVTEAVETLQGLATSKGIVLRALSGEQTLTASLDPARILQVLVNLISNGLKFTPSGGQVAVNVETVGDGLHFSVADNGQGIPEDKLESIFERFVRVDEADRSGQGLGLYISKCIVRGHGGQISATSTLGQGTTIDFTLPAALKSAALKAQASTQSS